MNYLVPVDFSATSDKLIKAIPKLISDKENKIFVLHVAEPAPALAAAESGPDVVRGQMAEEFRKEHKAVQAYAKKLRDKGFDATAILAQGAPVKTILEVAAKHKIGIIVMGSHGHSAAYQILVGSVSEGVLHKAPCPVLFVPSQK